MPLNEKAQKLLKEWIMSQEDRYSILTEDLAKFICELVLDTPSHQDVSDRLITELDVFFQERTAEFLKELSQCLRLKTYHPRDRALTNAQQLAVQKRAKRSAAQLETSDGSATPTIGAERASKVPRTRTTDAVAVHPSGLSAPIGYLQPFFDVGVGSLPTFPNAANTDLGFHMPYSEPNGAYPSFPLSTEAIVARIRVAQASEACELFSKTGICLLGKSCPFKHQTASGKRGANLAQPDSFGHDIQYLNRRYARAQKRHQEHDRRRADLQLELLNVDADRMSLLARLAAKEGAGPADADDNENNNGDGMSMADLRAKLASLKAEAVSLGLNEDGSTRTPRQHHHLHQPKLRYSRPANTFAPHSISSPAARYRYNHSFSVAHAPARPSASVLRVDHRPKTVAITLADTDKTFADAATTAALRTFLRAIGPLAALTAPPDKASSARRRLATFDARYLAERLGDFVARLGGCAPGLGRVELAWADEFEVEEALAQGAGGGLGLGMDGVGQDLLAGPVDLDVD